MKRLLFLLIPLSFICADASGQTEGEDFIVYGNDTVLPIRDGRFVLHGKIYRQHAPNLTLGYGAGYNFKHDSIEQNMMITYHHFLGNMGLSLGYHTSSNIKVWWRSYQKLNDFWLGAGYHYERPRYHFSAFAGPSLAYGSWIAWSDEHQENRAYGFTTVGGVAEVQMTYRLFYDVGLGMSLYGSLNRFYAVAGAQIHLFFSTAFVRNY